MEADLLSTLAIRVLTCIDEIVYISLFKKLRCKNKYVFKDVLKCSWTTRDVKNTIIYIEGNFDPFLEQDVLFTETFGN